MPARLHGGDEDAKTAARLFEFVRDVTTGSVSENVECAARQRFLGGLGPERSRARRARVVGASLVLAAGATAAHLGGASSAAWSADESLVLGNGYVSGSAGETPTVRFAEGSQVDFAAGSRGRVEERSATRARVVLERGRASVHAGRQPERFLVEAGPYALRSGGGAFDVSWSGDVFEVRVESGAVVLDGPEASNGLILHEDQSFMAGETDKNGAVRCF